MRTTTDRPRRMTHLILAAVPFWLTLGAVALPTAAVASPPTVPASLTQAAPTQAVATGAVAMGAVSAETAAVEWSVAPADAEGPDGRVSLRHVLDPGASVQDAIAVTNLGAQPATFTVEAGDGVVGADGAFDVASGEAAGAGTWVEVAGLEDGTLTLDGGETRVLPVDLAVPADATPGDHPAGIVVAVSREEGGVTVTHRVGVRLHLQVAGDLAPALAAQDVQVGYERSWVPFAPGTVTVDYTVVNAGNVRLGAAATASAAGPLGLLEEASRGGTVELLPGDTAERRVEMTAWPLGQLAGEVSVAALALGEDQVVLPPASSRSFAVAAVPLPELAALGVVAAGVVLLRRRARTRSPRVAPVATGRAVTP